MTQVDSNVDKMVAEEVTVSSKTRTSTPSGEGAPPNRAPNEFPLQSSVNADGNREVGALLGIGIFAMPYLCAWFTLRKGHSTLSRVTSFSWMSFMIYAKFFMA